MVYLSRFVFYYSVVPTGMEKSSGVNPRLVMAIFFLNFFFRVSTQKRCRERAHTYIYTLAFRSPMALVITTAMWGAVVDST